MAERPVAIIGLGMRLPGADDLDGFWQHLAAERSLISEVPPERWDAAELKGDPANGNKTASIWGGFVDGADTFDAAFFGISPREAAWMDPQQRFALEMAWHAIEDAGYAASALAGTRTGVFMGCCHWDYAELLEKHLAQLDAYLPTGIAFSIIANRVSHFFDFRGPSITNDTACAASLTSLFEAVRALQAGECDLALAGGVNLIWSPNHFVAFSKAGMLARDGRSKAFDEAADGYVRGEGGAVLLLKPLSRALEDGDPIHAVIAGIGVNHGGRTNSLTVTNPAAQAELIARVHREAGVPPDAIDYIEAHGPGTPLGDPIEVSGLKEAFATRAAETGVSFRPETCGIGSVKTNIGHLEGAAGVAGIVKVLAALRHGRIPANVGFSEMNRLIDLAGTPFRIQKEATDWQRRDDCPRRAGVSSFGFGGSNAHVLLEDAPARAHSVAADEPVVVPLSAASEDRLEAFAERLLRFVEENGERVTLADLAVTFQYREAMDARIAVVAATLDGLAVRLRAYLAGGEAILPGGEDPSHDLARRWIAGADVDWPHCAGRRIHAPLYPFDRHRHWMDLSLGQKPQGETPHPLLHRNASGFAGPAFETVLSGDEFVLADHHVNGTKVLPGVAGLEMARAAARLAGGLEEDAFAIENVVWSRPIALDGQRTVRVETRLTRKGGAIAFALQTGEASPNLQGILRSLEIEASAGEDLAALRTRLTERIDPATCYERLFASGVDHGPAFRALSQVCRGGNEVLAQLKLPRRLLPSLEQMPLHPVLLDAAIQAWVALGDGPPPGAGVPFSCEKVEVFGPCAPVMWAHLRLRPGAASVRHLDIDLFDKDGQKRVAIRDLVLRVLAPAETHEPPTKPAFAAPVILADGIWREAPLTFRADEAAETRILLAGSDAAMAEALARRTRWPVDCLPSLEGRDPADAAEILFRAVHGILAETLAKRPAEPVSFLVLATEPTPATATAPLAALLRTAASENPKLSGRVVSLAGAVSPDRLGVTAMAEARAADGFTEICYDAAGTRSVWKPEIRNIWTSDPPFFVNPDGVYWIIGGLGGLGTIFAGWLVDKGAKKLVLSGRRQTPDPEGEEALDALKARGAEILYLPGDIASPDDVEALVCRVAELGPLKGVIHAAGILQDGYILTQGADRAVAAFAPKVAGTVHLDRATRDAPLDFFVLCSSVAAVFGNPGQAGYAAANAFMDAFAEARAGDPAAPGKTVSIAWPLWAEGGMSVDAATLAAMEKRLGLTPLPTAAGLSALEALLAADATPRTTVLHGDATRIHEVLGAYGQEPTPPAPVEKPIAKNAAPAPDDAALTAFTVAHVRDILAEVLELDAARIRPDRKLEEYGLDSIAIVEATSRLEEALGPLSKTLFFEFVDLAGVAGHLVAEKGEVLRALFADEHPALDETPPPEPPRPTAAIPLAANDDRISSSPPDRKPGRPRRPPDASDDNHDIAIVGLSLRVAGAADQDAFWKMLSEGLHGFTPVPAERWDHAAIHHPERDVPGKTVVKTGAFLADIDKFDPRYFRISQAEAELMSPEVRLFLEASVEAFEDAGYSRETMARRYGGDVAVIVGSMTNEYDLYGFQNMLLRGALASGSYTGTVPNMVSYFYGFTGPSYFLDTMCSAASTCVHEAVHMLRAGRCKMALAGGVSLLLHPQKLIATSQEHFTSKSADVIRGYGLGADGTILGEGVGALVLKPLAEARRDGDHVYGVIIGSGISNAGVRNGFTVPNPNQQAVAIEAALDDAGIGAETIGYVEGHGSGTALGDPIEVKALTTVFRKATDAVQTVPVGTVKSNVAHLLGASGLAGIAKVLAQLKHGQLAPSLHAETLNPDIPFATSPFYVQRELAEWVRLKDADGAELLRRAGVTSIGAGGMNSHIVIEEAPHLPALPEPEGPELLVFSALNPERLKVVLERFRDHLRSHPDERLADLAFTLQVGKNELSARLAIIAQGRDEALAAIDRFLRTGEPGDGTVYQPSILDCDPPGDREALDVDCAARRLDRIADAWCRGAVVDWDLVNRGRALRRVSLPAYPFEKVRCWYREEPDAPSVIRPLGAGQKLHPFVGVNRSDAAGLRFETGILLTELRDYVFADAGREAILPLAAVDALAAAASLAGLSARPTFRQIQIQPAKEWAEIASCDIRINGNSNKRPDLAIDTIDRSGDKRTWARGLLSADGPKPVGSVDLAASRASALEELDAKTLYGALKARGLTFGPYLETVAAAWRLTDGSVLCRLRPDPPQQDAFKKNARLPAPALGAAWQALLLARPGEDDAAALAIDAIALADGAVTDVLCRPDGSGGHDILFLDGTGTIVAELSGVSVGASGAEERGVAAVPDGAEAGAPIDASTKLPASLPANALCDDLRRMAASILKFAPADISLREPFHDLGFDSISLTRYAGDISAAFGIALSPAIFFECEHIEALADHLASRYSVAARPNSVATVPAKTASDTVSAPAIPAGPAVKTQRPQAVSSNEKIAIVGMAGRFPESPDVETFFDNLLAGRDLTSDLPLERYSPTCRARLDAAGFTKRGGFLSDIDRFDAAFFRISPAEAERMDPQQRLLLETAWRALEDAGYAPEELPRAGVFVGITSLDYADLWRAEGLPADGFLATGNSLAMAANRISHRFDLSGPSEAIDTACSSSLVALLRARDALLAGKCDAALVGGVNLCLAPDGFEGPHQAGMLSPTGRCHTFAADADGYARGEGVAVLVLKRLVDAERDGDRVLAVVAGGAENHGGRAGALTAPNAKAQARLIVEAMAGIDPETISFIEVHGTGTELGDPVEINGLKRAYEELLGERRADIGLGAVKPNIGHLEAAAGLAGVVKVVMAMGRGELPPTIGCDAPNPHIDLQGSPFRLVTAREAWPKKNDAPRRAGVSSFGFGGTNAHVVLESYDGAREARRSLPPRQFADARFWIPFEKETQSETLLFAAEWAPQEASGTAFAGRRIVVACGVPVAEAGTEIVDLAPTGMTMAERYRDAAGRLLRFLKKEMAAAIGDDVLIQLAVPADDALFAGLGSMLRTASEEEPRLKAQIVEVPAATAPATAARWLQGEAGGPAGTHSRYVAGRREVRRWRALSEPAPAERWQDGGVYLLTGGMGGLGRLVARDIAESAKGAVLVLAGSGPLDEDRTAFLEELRGLGAVAAYRRVDVADKAAVKALVDHIVEVHGKLTAVLHCAGILRDGFLATKTEDDLGAVLAPKVAGSLALVEACAGRGVEEIVFFSSLAGPFGNAGQADYAAANGFLDALAERGAGETKITAIDWPLWQDGGMTVDSGTRDALFRRMGQRPLSAQSGLDALARARSANAAQVAVVAGDAARIRRFFAPPDAPPATPRVDTGPAAAAPSPDIAKRTREKLRALFAGISGLAEAAIDPAAPLEDYGIDSLMITRLNNELSGRFAALPKTLFFRHRTLAAVADHLAEAQPAACRAWTGLDKEPAQLANTFSRAAAPAAISIPAPDDPIAIIGLSGAYPDAPDPDAFWENLVAGHDAVTEIPEERWPLGGFFEPDPDEAAASGKSYSKWGAFLQGFADFDPLFFRISPRDAAAMDPQERLFLTAAWQAVEDAGYSPARLKAATGGRVGVFVGATKTGYALHGPFRAEGGAMVRPSTSFAAMANRVSFVLDLCGPSVPVDTMCSSSLTAIHEAVQHLAAGTCEMAIAGGVNLYLHPATYADLSAAHMLSPTGRCRSFGAGADGFVPGEGVGCVVLKPLSAALEDGDRIHAVIRGTAVNHGGRTNGFTVPNPLAQRDVVRAALAKAGLSAGDISYIEAHGTGTDLGDPIEIDGLSEAFAGAPGACALGSVKSQIGHLEAAAGIAGMTKVVLQMREKTFAPSLHADDVNPNLDLAITPFVLQRAAVPWRSEAPRRAGISSFGAGGANAHVIVEEAPLDEAAATDGGPQAIVLSARTEERLQAAAGRLLAFLEKKSRRSVAPDRDALAGALSRQLADLLGVESADIDPTESFDGLGLEPSDAHALRRAANAAFGTDLGSQDLAAAGSIAGLAGLIAATAAPTASAGPALADIAYTLQVGREPMDARLGIMASDVDDLGEKLHAWLAGSDVLAGVFAGNAGGPNNGFAALSGDEVLAEVIARAWATGRAETLLRLWVEGVEIDWPLLRAGDRARIVSLPTYPFEAQKYWIPEDVRRASVADAPRREHTPDAAVCRAVEAPCGDTLLLGAMDAFDEAIAGVLKSVLGDVSMDASVEKYRPWRAAAESLLADAPEVDPAEASTAWQARREVSPAQWALADAALKALPEILTGRLRATDVLFPDGRQTLVEAVYKENAVAARFSRTLAEAAAGIVAEGTGRELRILEIGAGTGGTSEPVFDALQPHADRIAEYCYTDVSKAFLIHAERDYAGRVPGLRTALFDVERRPQEQGLGTGYDLIIAANVLHATADIHRTLSHVREVLAPGGTLLLNETSRPTLFTHVTFGLLDGWWRFTDPDRRIPGTPSLTLEAWRRALEGAGFAFVAGSSEPERALGQQIVVARAGGAPAGETPSGPKAIPTISDAAASPPPRENAVPSGTLRDRLLAALAETLNVAPERIEADKSFADYGLDSILGAEFVHRLRKSLGIALDQTTLFDFSNVTRLEAHLTEDHADAVTRLVEPGAPPIRSKETVAAIAAPAIRTAPAARTDPIAIVGASGRFAKSETVDALWEHLLAGDDLVEPVTRFDLAPFYRNAAPGTYGRHGSFLDAVDRFDPVFFGISGLEATYMDPQQRLFLEEAWKMLENAGHAGTDMVGRRCGVFVGASHGDYQELFADQPPGQAFWGNTASLIPARISYWLDLKGPAVAADTACSSSLVALHLACRSIRDGECEMALAGGVFVQSSPRFFRYANAAGMLSPTGRCAAFGAGADGIVPGEAVGAVLLRPLADARADGDTVLGLIAATGTNQDGTTNGITAPSAASQERLIRETYEAFGIDPASIDMVEAHGTGTVLGDPIEHAALARAFAGVDKRILLGSVKSNIGHATTAAGIAGLLKVLWSLKHETIPPSLHFAGGNPAIDFLTSPFRVNGDPVPWPKGAQKKRRAAISSFGFSGTNAHVVVEEAPDEALVPEPTRTQLFVLSARTPEQLKSQAKRLADHLETHPELTPEDVAFTLIAGRRAFEHRLALVAEGLADVTARVRAWLRGDPEGDEETGATRAASAAEDAEASLPTAVTATDGDRRMTDLRTLGRAFLGGMAPDPKTLFTAPRRRVPLPTYPFADRRYWVGRQGTSDGAARAAAAASSESILSPQARPAPAMAAAAAPSPSISSPADDDRAVPTAAPRPADAPSSGGAQTPVSGERVSLANPAVVVASIGAAATGGAMKVRLAPLGVRQTSTAPLAGTLAQRAPATSSEAAGSVTRRPDADGVRVLDLAGRWDRSLEAALAAELDVARTDEAVRCVVLAGRDAWCGEGAFDPAMLVDCAVPVVAAVSDAASGTGALTALLADFLVLADGMRFEAIPEPATDLGARLPNRRIGARVSVSAADLAAAGCLVRPATEVEAAARDLARRIAEAPREALMLLKNHMRRQMPVLVGDARPDPLSLDLSAEPPVLAPQTIPLRSDVIELERFADGVVLIKMIEKTGRNMFTPAFMDGLDEAFAAIAGMADAKVVVLTGFEAYFACGGTADGLAELQAGAGRFTDRRIYALPLACDLPVIAAMQGHAIGAGWSLGLFCDAAVLAEEGVYHSNYLWYGFTPGAGATLVFPARLGDDLGREVLFSAREYRGAELGRRSARVTMLPARDVLPGALAAAHALAARPRADLIAEKAVRAAPLREGLDAVLQREVAMHEKTFIGNDAVRARIAEKFGSPPAEPAPPAPMVDAARVKSEIIASLAETLMIDTADIRDGDSFLDLGLDSILAVTWIRGLNARYAIDLPATAVYAHPSVGALAAHIAALLPVDERLAPGDAPAVAMPAPLTAEPAPVPAAAKTHGSMVKSEIIASLAETLMIEPSDIRAGDSFLDLGLDSILAVTWIRGLNARYGIELPATAVYAHPSVGALAEHIAALLPAEEEPASKETPVMEPTPATPQAAPVAPVAMAAPEPVAALQFAASAATWDSGPQPIAIIGASGAFPKAGDLEQFWENIRSGRDCISEVPASRWKIADFYDPDPQAPGKTYCKWMGALDEPGAFDARFFAITPREAELMDPQQRLFLQSAWHAIEDAAIDPQSLSGTRTGVYVASGASGYEDRIAERNTYSLLGASGSILAARISYLLDLRGPALSVDTACSSSLVALCQACDSLAAGAIDLALAGGVSVLVGPKMFIDTAKVAMLSPDGRCFAFDDRANGFVPGEGVGAVLLKRLCDAERDGDPIRAVIRGWGLNQDGRTNGITAPNPEAQTALLKDVYARFSIDPATIGLVECHGTGTSLGDPIEVEGLTGAFAGVPDGCALGSVKSNVGHLLASAGIAGALKAMLALEHRQIPPSIHVETLNRHIPFDRTPFAVSRELRDWPGKRHRAAVSSFGFSGTNAHVVLEEATAPEPRAPAAPGPHVFVVSARTREALTEAAGTLERFVAARPDLDLADLAVTLQSGRSAFGERLAVIASDRDTLLRALASVVAGAPITGVHLSSGDRDAVAPYADDADARGLVAKWLTSGDAGRLEKAADLWAKGLDIHWREIHGARRLRLPGYPFARTTYWIDEQEKTAEASLPALAASLLGSRPAAGEIGRMTVRIDGTEPWLTSDVGGVDRRLLGLFLPELARAAAERMTGAPVRHLTHLLWGRPVVVNGRPRDLTLAVMADAEGLLYRIEADGEAATPCHLGSLSTAPEAEPATVEPAALLGGTDATAKFAAFARRLAAPSPQSPEMARATDVRHDGSTISARLERPRGAQPAGALFDPLFLDPVWRLVPFASGRADARLALPMSIAAMTGFSAPGDTAFVRIEDVASGVSATLFDAGGRETLRIEGIRTVPFDRSRDILLGEEAGP
ncbi:SDR family NAD(P)-dependent oxidoreductase [Rhodobium gokarnense]|uniref:Acyl transferase domain-containing protein/aryl carrier-like protein/1,4-dihydroxy-2-naphthoyl-CoA synthase n=1 Tax=Rhodobium gokarnense TaxID=364296 RepID=A0ABT3H866_9HYPH|nr:SDR family NAD(P)-dependent oxidoreductase [Rhodobium gokarnense]MCW2306576.1 acyl transferase domain-containing protein/aryl carrier-like protein/1,4-dihydroxy-2-naphthoyl-CoA synthase [Rhodobium gokarnense]